MQKKPSKLKSLKKFKQKYKKNRNLGVQNKFQQIPCQYFAPYPIDIKQHSWFGT